MVCCHHQSTIQHLNHPPYWPDWVLVDFFLLPNMKEALVRHTADADSLKTAWVGVTTTIAKKSFTADFRQ